MSKIQIEYRYEITFKYTGYFKDDPPFKRVFLSTSPDNRYVKRQARNFLKKQGIYAEIVEIDEPTMQIRIK